MDKNWVFIVITFTWNSGGVTKNSALWEDEYHAEKWANWYCAGIGTFTMDVQ